MSYATLIEDLIEAARRAPVVEAETEFGLAMYAGVLDRRTLAATTLVIEAHGDSFEGDHTLGACEQGCGRPATATHWVPGHEAETPAGVVFVKGRRLALCVACHLARDHREKATSEGSVGVWALCADTRDRLEAYFDRLFEIS